MNTQIELAREGYITEPMEKVGSDEGFTGEVIRHLSPITIVNSGVL